MRATITADATALAAAAPPRRRRRPAAEARSRRRRGPARLVRRLTAEAVKGRRILIVEDAVLLALELEAGLTEAGAKVVGSAADVEEALQLAETPFDVGGAGRQPQRRAR